MIPIEGICLKQSAGVSLIICHDILHTSGAMAGPGDFSSADPSKGVADNVVPAAPLLPDVVA